MSKEQPTQDEKARYREGLSDATIMMLDVLLGENTGLIAEDRFDELKFDGELGDDLHQFLLDARANAQVERRQREKLDAVGGQSLCPTCYGSGQAVKNRLMPCSRCMGDGLIRV